ncbi:MAG: laccase domain-containing protein, partial [Solirubrobacteraceae bacterium]
MLLKEPFYELGGHFAIDLPGARAAFSTRRGGCSTGLYEGLNLGWATDDDPSAVERNRMLLREQVGAPPLSFTRQVHGAEVLALATAPGAGAPRADADGQA